MVNWLLYIILRVIGFTLRYRLIDESGLIAPGLKRNYIFACWHNRILLMPGLYLHFVGRKPIAALASASRDGDYAAGVVQLFGFTAVRGSTSRRAHQGFLELTRLAMEGSNATITPDGPRGPRYVAQSGVIKLATVTGLPILPVGIIVEPCKRLKSWDRTIIPLPFARCTAHVGKPIIIPRDADDATVEKCRLEVQRAMIELSGESA
ncbi:MAG: lysophospholipid acyltransferase family protein [Verrucomicrobia bacterium]|nr:lysophospholipid acyltransferase family protein [Verrucomicrobiota bacterium]